MATAADTRDVGLAQQLSTATSGGNSPLDKLLQHQAKETHMVKEKIKQLMKFKQDYVALKTRLETLPDKVSHDVMVPLNKLAFLPGKVKHTNEILCLLGDNWFVERSAKQAAQIVERRIKGCDETIKKFEGELKLMDGWSDQTKHLHQELNLNQGVNITETEEDEGWREEHRRKVKEYKQKMAALKDQQSESRETTAEEDLWRRLDELELQEELQHELDLLGVDDESEDWVSQEDDDEEAVVENEEEPTSKGKKSVRWSESPVSVKQFRRDELILPRTPPPSGSTSQNDEDEDQDTLKITFKHSTTSNKKSAKFAAVADSGDPSSSVVSSPSEIFRKFSSSPTSTSECCSGSESGSREPKSILKVKKSTTPVIEIVQELEEKQQEGVGPDSSVPGAAKADPQPLPLCQQQQTPAAVGDEVKERGETASSAATAAAVVDQESINTHRPVSRFRAARMNKKL